MLINKEINTQKNDNFAAEDLYQETNSNSHLSTTSEGEQGINANYNNYFIYQSFNEDEKINKKNKIDNDKNNKNIYELIKKGIKDISDSINSNKINPVSFACYYFCNINLNEEDEFFITSRIEEMIDNNQKIKNEK